MFGKDRLSRLRRKCFEEANAEMDRDYINWRKKRSMISERDRIAYEKYNSAAKR